eukprot:gene17422-23724_t
MQVLNTAQQRAYVRPSRKAACRNLRTKPTRRGILSSTVRMRCVAGEDLKTMVTPVSSEVPNNIVSRPVTAQPNAAEAKEADILPMINYLRPITRRSSPGMRATRRFCVRCDAATAKQAQSGSPEAYFELQLSRDGFERVVPESVSNTRMLNGKISTLMHGVIAPYGHG